MSDLKASRTAESSEPWRVFGPERHDLTSTLRRSLWPCAGLRTQAKRPLFQVREAGGLVLGVCKREHDQGPGLGCVLG